MIERAGASVVLSVVVVLLATALLHKTGVHPIPDGDDPPVAAEKVADIEPVPPNVPAPVIPPRPPEPLTRVDAAGSLAEFVHRVYGEGADPKALWKLNRDQLPGPDSPLAEGMILRTPPTLR